MKYFDVILSLFFLGLALLYEWTWRRNDRKKINSHIKRLGGEILSVQKIAFRDHIYSVEYTVDGEKHSKTVKFDIFQEEIWF